MNGTMASMNNETATRMVAELGVVVRSMLAISAPLENRILR
jgi:hypothetical protein